MLWNNHQHAYYQNATSICDGHKCLLSRAVAVKVCDTNTAANEMRSQQRTSCEQQLFGTSASKQL